MIICSTVASECDNQKESEIPKRSYNGRKSLRFIEKYEDKLTFVVSDNCDMLPSNFDKDSNDNKILNCAIRNDASILTLDRGMKIKALALGIECIDINSKEEEVNYEGYKVFEWDCSNPIIAYKLNDLAVNESNNIFEIGVNEFAILKDVNRPIFDEDGITKDYEIQSILQWDGVKYNVLKYKNINNSFTKVSPRNLEQKLAFALMQNDSITVKILSGIHGSGKDIIMLSNALELIQKGKYDKIVWFRNATNIRGIKELGFLPGDVLEKMAPYSAVLDDILGEKFGTEMFLANGKLEIGNLGAVRGRTFKNSIMILTEMQNCSTEIIQLLISRVGEGSILCMNGDFKQIDDVVVGDSCIRETIEVLHGHPKFGWVDLKKVERSETANLATLFDK